MLLGAFYVFPVRDHMPLNHSTVDTIKAALHYNHHPKYKTHLSFGSATGKRFYTYF